MTQPNLSSSTSTAQSESCGGPPVPREGHPDNSLLGLIGHSIQEDRQTLTSPGSSSLLFPPRISCEKLRELVQEALNIVEDDDGDDDEGMGPYQ